MQTSPAALYHDFGGLADLRLRARQDAEAALEPVATQFEAIFVQLAMKSMRDATIEGGLFNSSQLQTWQTMFDQQLSLDLADNGGLGLARILVDQLQAAAGSASTSEDGAAVSSVFPPRPGQQAATAPVPAAMAGSPVEATAPRPPLAAAENPLPAPATALTWQPVSQEEFIRDLWPLAVPAAAELGVEPEVLIAQAALETGWGRRALKAGGSSSFNLFNIKAGQSWQGPTTVVRTLEYDAGGTSMERAAFRVYDSPASSFDDYVDLIQRAPRYSDALAQASNPEAYLRELQAAGYATDPNYADKILAILAGDPVSSMVAELKNSAAPPPLVAGLSPRSA